MITLIKSLNEESKKRNLIVFLSTSIIGLISHAFIFFNKISIFDDISSINGFSANWLFALGRFTQGFIKILNDKLFGTYSNSFLNGIISLFLISLTNIMIVKILDIKKTINVILISSVITTSTGLLCLYAYMYAAVFYTISIFLSVLSTYAYIYYEFKYRLIKYSLVLLLIFMSITIYQSYFLFGLVLYLYYLLRNGLDGKIDKKNILLYIFIVMLALVCVRIVNALFFQVYNFLNTKLNLSYDELTLTSYQGINSLSIHNVFTLAGIIKVFKHIFIHDEILFGNIIYVYYAYLFFALCGIISIIVSNNYDITKKIYLTALMISIYVVINSLYILPFNSHLYALPLFPKCLVFIMPIVIIEYIDINKFLQYVATIIFMYFLLYNISISNSTYLNRYIRQSAEISWCERLAARIENTAGYNDDYDIYCYGEKKGWDILKNDTKFNSDDLIIYSIAPWNYSSINQYNFLRYMEYFTGFKSLSFKYNQFHGNEDLIANMPCYPDDGSIQVVDSKIYIKFSEPLE